jgi:hypothetical protein
MTAAAGGALLFALAGCGGSSSAGTATPPASGAGGGGTPAHPAALIGDVGHNDAFSISLTDPQGNPITNLAAGTYQLTVHDESAIHDFHLTGAGVDEATTVGDKTDKTFTVTFKPGTYTFMCDPHASQMHGSFRVS